jgi:hypothetical protein
VGACWPDIKTMCPRAQIIITTYGELDKNNYLDPRTAQVATVDHIKQKCTKLRPAADEELPSAYIEDFRYHNYAILFPKFLELHIALLVNLCSAPFVMGAGVPWMLNYPNMLVKLIQKGCVLFIVPAEKI